MTGCRLPRQNELSTGLNIPMKWRRCVQSKKLMLLFLVLISRLATTSGRSRSSGSSSGSSNQCTPKEVACTCTEYTKINATGGFHRGREFKYCSGERTSTLAYNGSFCCKWERPGQSCDYCAKLKCPYGSITRNDIGHCASKDSGKYFAIIFGITFPLIWICFLSLMFRLACPRVFEKWCKCCPKRCQPTWPPDEPNIPVSFLSTSQQPPVASSEEAEHPPLASSKEAEHPPLATSKEADIPLATSNPIHGPMDVEMAKTKITTHNA